MKSDILPQSLVTVLIVISSLIEYVRTNDAPKQIDFTSTNTIIIPENKAINSTIGTIKAQDSDGPMPIIFSIQDEKTKKLVRLGETTGDSAIQRQVDIILIAPLDRDRDPSDRKLYFIMADGDSSIDHNQLTIQISLYITDVNDEHPEFNTRRYKESVDENASIGLTVGKVTAIDEDNGLGGKVTYSMKPASPSADIIYRNAFRINPNSGDVIVNSTLDYEKHNFYEFVISAQDGMGLKSTADADFVITIKDIQDTPPAFYNQPYTITLKENISVNTQVLQLTALDGDRGVPNDIQYQFTGTGGDNENFALDSNTGWITVKKPLDRDSDAVKEKGGVYAMTVEASEIIKPGDINHGSTTASTSVTITVQDVNDNKPEFNHNVYFAEISENMKSPVPVIFKTPTPTMSVTDIDQGENSHFSITFEKDGQPYYDFYPEPRTVYSVSTLLIRVNNSDILDYEKMNSTTFQVIARELNTEERRSSEATVHVEIIDVNDITPHFGSELYNANISENSATNTPVITINATDEDSGINGQITYSLRGGNGKFSIHSTTGDVLVAGDLDREKVDQYYLTVEAKDGGGFRSTTELHIRVTDENDNSPEFRREEYFRTIKENDKVFQREKLVVEAFDIDEPNSPNSLIKFEIKQTPNGLENNFFMDAQSGEITVQSALDYESLDPTLNGRVILIVEAMDWGVPQKSRLINVTIEVEDENDNAPKFNQTSYTAHVLENASDTSIVTRLIAKDDDGTFPNNEFVYRIDSGSQDQFRINFKTGEISVETGARLDRETKPRYDLNVSATDRGSTTLIGYCQVTIFVDDVNDEKPYFSPHSPVFIFENANINDQVTHFTANDIDNDAVLHYSILQNKTSARDENGNDVDVTSNGIQDYFTIEESSGLIKVNTDGIDRETAETIILEVLATDIKAVENLPQTATGTLTIILKDKNDNAPTFTENGNYHVNCSEGRDINDVVFTIMATDKDKNQKIRFSIPTENIGAFTINSMTGTVFLASKLDREANPEVKFKVIATDDGIPSLTSTATVTITVTDANDNPPIFIQPVGPQSVISIKEQQPIGSPIITIIATDKDLGRNGKVQYSLSAEDDYLKFTIDSITGELKNKVVLDREERPQYKIRIEAIDDGLPNKLKTTLALTINLIDINDKDPEFPRDPPSMYQPYLIGVVPEEREDILVGSVDVAIDKDSDANNSQIFYYIIGGEMQDHFSLNESGLYLVKSINRDDDNSFGRPINFINLVIFATPFNYLKISHGPVGDPATSEGVVPSGYKGLNRTLLWARVRIRDINDHSPEFKETSLSIGITRKTQFGEIIFNLKNEVRDKDIDGNSNHTFEQYQPMLIYPSSLSQSIGSNAFKFFSNGTLKTNTYFQADMNGYFLMYVRARDKDGKSANATLRISLINDDQRLKVIFRMFPEEVRNFSTAFKNRLEDITGYKIVVDKIQTHENDQGKPEVDKSDMFIHGETVNPFSIVDAAELLRVIDASASALISVLNDYNIVQIVPTSTQAEEDDSKRQLTMAIILLAIILGIPCIAMMFVIYFMYKKYQRKLKAATAMSYAYKGNDSRDSDMQKLQLPGTNIHSYENANPIFLEKILIEEAGEQADSDSIDENVVDSPNSGPRYDEQEASLQFAEESEKQNDLGSPDMNIKAALQAHNVLKNNNNVTNGGFKVSNGSVEVGSLDTKVIEGLQTTEI